jgi:hypothetical protein
LGGFAQEQNVAIKIFAQIEVSIDERFSRIDNVSITLDEESLAQLANAVAAQLRVQLTGGILPASEPLSPPTTGTGSNTRPPATNA